ncbi:MAG: WD40 repeat protein [Paraglaciecola sp.]|jgi:WD40 repeat protein
MVVTASDDKNARVWDVKSGKVVAILEGHKGEVYNAAFSPDGREVVTASGDKTARVWTIPPLRNLLNGPRTVCLARN